MEPFSGLKTADGVAAMKTGESSYGLHLRIAI